MEPLSPPGTPRAAPAAALLLAAHGERNVPEPNALLAAHADALAELLPHIRVTYGVLNGEPAFEDALLQAAQAGAGRILVYPFFMAEGYFTASALPERVAAAGCSEAVEILRPLGEAAGLPQIMLDDALAAAHRADFDPAATRLLVVGHGSRSDAGSAQATARVADALRERGAFAEVAIALLEEPPGIAEQLEASALPAVVSGFFAGGGMHAARDVPDAIARSRTRAVYAGPVGASPQLRDIIAGAVREKMGRGC
ncbi:MAG: hypothetical protein Kow0032_17430 [Methyloligellaceae bacterium]